MAGGSGRRALNGRAAAGWRKRERLGTPTSAAPSGVRAGGQGLWDGLPRWPGRTQRAVGQAVPLFGRLQGHGPGCGSRGPYQANDKRLGTASTATDSKCQRLAALATACFRQCMGY